MDVFSLIGIIFFENLLAILGLAAFVFLLREYLKRRQRFLLPLALIFLAYFLANAGTYVGQILHVYGLTGAAAILVRGIQLFSVVEALLLLIVLIDLYGGRYKWFWSIFAPAVPLVSLYFELTSPKNVGPFHGLVFPDLALRDFAGTFAAWLLACVVLLTLPKLSPAQQGPKDGRRQRPEHYLFGAGFCGLLFYVLIVAIYSTGLEGFYYVAQLAYIAHVALLFIGGATLAHPEPLYRERPTAILSRSLVIKAAGLSALLFWVLAFALLGATASYFVRLTGASDEQTLRILAVVSLLLILALSAMTAILLFSVEIVLRPIHDLAAAARKIEEGDYAARAAHASPDELGELAAAFNQMGETIGERTRRLQAALEEERDFLMHTAMEVRSPLNIFRWTIEMMRFGDTGRLTKEQLELLEQMHQTTQRLITFSQNLLDASLLEQGKVSLKKEPIQVEDVIDEVAGEYAIKLREKDINLHWNRPSKPLPRLMGDRERVKQSLMHVIGNAVKYTRDSGHIEVWAAESSTAGPGARHGRFIKISVEDNGRGIPKAEQDRVLTPFFRGSNVVKEDMQGIGLGLFIVKELIKLHGGKIWFESAEGEGTTFHLTFPVERAPRRGAGAASE